jgi:4,5-DOPA dioxygenase extradiol
MTLPALYIGHGAPMLLEDQTWTSELAAWSAKLPTPRGILIISAHWESAPLMIGSTGGTDLIYDFGGFHPKYYQLQYQTPDAAWIAESVRKILPDTNQPHHASNRGLDHGAYIPLMVMYPEANIPVLQMSIPSSDPKALMELGRRLRPLRDEGILLIGSGFLTHGLPYLRDWSPNAVAPGWSVDFDEWADENLQSGNIEALMNYQNAPGLKFAHPTLDHLLPMYVTLGAASDAESKIESEISGFWLGLSKRSFAVN